jgi:hypothetical protein
VQFGTSNVDVGRATEHFRSGPIVNGVVGPTVNGVVGPIADDSVVVTVVGSNVDVGSLVCKVNINALRKGYNLIMRGSYFFVLGCSSYLVEKYKGEAKHLDISGYGGPQVVGSDR